MSARGGTTGGRLARQGVLYTIGLVLQRAGNFALIPLISRALTVAQYGAWQLLNPYVDLLSQVAAASQGSSLLRLGVDVEKDEKATARLLSTVLTYAAAASIVLVVVVALLWPTLADYVQGVPLWPIGAAALTGVTGGALFQLATSWLQLRGQARQHTLLNALRWVIYLPLVAGALVLGWEAEGLLLARGLSFAAGALLAIRALPAGLRLAIHGPTLRASLSYGLPLLPHALASVIFQATDKTLLAANPAHGMDVAGVYAIGVQLASAVFMVAMGMQRAWVPFFLREDRDRAERGWARVRDYSFFAVSVVACGAVGLGLLAPELLRMLVWFNGQPAYLAAAAVVPVLTLGALLRGYYLVVAAVVMAEKGTARWLAAVTLPAAALNIVLNALWIPRWGMQGAAWATCAAFAATALATGVLARRARKVPFKYGRATVLLALATAALFFGPDLGLVGRIGVLLAFGLALLALDGKTLIRAARANLGRKR